MKKRSEPSNGLRSDADKAKRVYRAALESIKCLDTINNEKKAYRVVFKQDAVGLRNKLKDYCEKLMFFNPLEYGRKAEEVLWRKVFYDVIQVIKKSKDHVRRHGSVETAYRTHLTAAAGFYQYLVYRLQREFSLKLAGVIDYYQLPEPRTARRMDSSSAKAVSPSVQEWAQRACHRCLICLGDISRYICDVDKIAMPAVSDRYYHQAFMLFPEIGMPHNQLGTLTGRRYCGCEAAYHYIRCLSCEKPFEGAKGNLTRLFEKNTKRFHQMNDHQTRDMPPEEQRHHDIKRFFTRFMKLLEIFHGNMKSTDMHELQQLCQHTLQDFNLCMFYEPQHKSQQEMADLEDDDGKLCDPGDPSSFQYLDDGIVFKIICCLICTIHLLEKKGSSNITAATAFMLTLFSHILNHVTTRLQGMLDEMENPNKILLAGSALSSEKILAEDSSGSDEEDNCDRNNDDNLSKIPKKSRAVKVPVRRRRRRRQLSSSSDGMSDLSEASDLSEGIDDHDDQILTSESEDNDLASYFDHGSDSDLSESEAKDQMIVTGNDRISKSQGKNRDKKQIEKGRPHANGDMQHIWSNGTGDNSLALISSELFSSSLMFLGQDLTQESFYDDKADVSVPPGFSPSLEAQHVADITEKLANFDIDTDTDVMFTDTEPSGFVTEPDDGFTENSSSLGNSGKFDLEKRRIQQTFEAAQSEGLLATVKIMCDWMSCQSAIISVCAQSSYSLWQRLSVLLNFLPHENEIVQHEMCCLEELQVTATRTRLSDWSQVFPLPEDVEMCQMTSLSGIHSQVDFTIRHRAQLNSMQEAFLRICCLRRFGYFLTTSVENIEFSYQPETAMFIGPPSDLSPQGGNDKDSMAKLRDAESRRNQLMRDMAQLRLQAEVNELEGSLKTGESPLFPPYVVVDTEALCYNLTNVKDIAETARCILVIPLAVVDKLDMEKKETPNAREAIRWLEAQLRKGNRYIRAQKTNETMPSSAHYAHLRKRNRELWYLMELLGCAQYLAQQSGSFTGHKVVVIMTGHEQLMMSPLHPTIQQAKTKAEQEGVSVETVGEFFSKRKSVLHHQSPG